MRGLLSLALLFLAVVQGQLEPDRCGCPDGWVTYGESCYLFEFKHGMHFTDAQNYCNTRNADLVVVTSAKENNFLKGYMEKMQNNNYWLGLSDLSVEGEWVWEASEEQVNFTDWKPGQPDSWHGVNEDCALFYQPDNHLWHDGPCDHFNQPLCEMPALNTNFIDVIG